MILERVCRTGIGLVVASLLAQPGAAQYSYLSRGVSDRSASTRVGRVGRTTTSFRVAPALGLRNPSRGFTAGGTAGGTVGGVPRFRASSFGGTSIGAGSSFALPAALARGRVGPISRPLARPYLSPGPQMASPHMLRNLSGLNSSFSLSTPLTRTAWNFVPELTDPPGTPEPKPSAFHEFFDLEPARPVEKASTDTRVKGLAELMEEGTQRQLRDVEARGFLYFREATRAEAEGRLETLARAIDLFDAVTELDDKAYVPLLLTIHAALEREQFMEASRALFWVTWRRPEVFAERPDLAQYYGDPSQLEEQMRAFLRKADELGGSGRIYALQAYCAWMLGDKARAEQALALADETSRGETEHYPIRTFQVALEAALR